jgi:hypothetical protein
MTQLQPRPSKESVTTRAPVLAGLRPRTWIVALILTGLGGWWVCQAEIVALACQITESVPAIPGLAALALLLIVNGLLRLTRRFEPFTRAELLAIFLFVTIATSMMGVGVMRFLLALMTAPFYFPMPGKKATQAALPDWVAVHDPVVIRRLFESDLHGNIPWAAWATPLLALLPAVGERGAPFLPDHPSAPGNDVGAGGAGRGGEPAQEPRDVDRLLARGALQPGEHPPRLSPLLPGAWEIL